MLAVLFLGVSGLSVDFVVDTSLATSFSRFISGAVLFETCSVCALCLRLAARFFAPQDTRKLINKKQIISLVSFIDVQFKDLDSSINAFFRYEKNHDSIDNCQIRFLL